MCHNHSHITADITGVLQVGEATMLELYITQPLGVELPYGEKWTRRAGTSLYLPLSAAVPLLASPAAAMVVCFTPLSYTVGNGSITTQERQTQPMSAGDYGAINLTDGGLSQVRGMGQTDDIS